ncbi:Ankyrin-2 [Dactylellina cionopaga]|nr:Ankyrin-2 [Dactylellina cionopaga]
MDPLSIAASVAGLIGLADIVSAKSYGYLSGVKDAPNQWKVLASEVSTLSGVLKGLEFKLKDVVGLQDGCLPGTSSLVQASGNPSSGQIDIFLAVEATLKKIETLLDKWQSAPLKSRLKWPFKESEVSAYLATIGRFKSTLTFALTGDTLKEQAAASKDIKVGVSDIQLDQAQARKEQAEASKNIKGSLSDIQLEQARIKKEKDSREKGTDVPAALKSLGDKCCGDKGIPFTNSPTKLDLLQLIQSLCSGFNQVYVHIDALDECPRDSRDEDILKPLKALVNEIQNLSLSVTSRHEPDIDKTFGDNSVLKIDAAGPEVAKDIATYVDMQIERRPRLKKHKDVIRDRLVDRADGMFRWVKCQLDILEKAKNKKSIDDSLANIPKGLYSTYDRIIDSIEDEEEQRVVYTALTWVAFSARYLTLRELREAVAIKEEHQNRDDLDYVAWDPYDILEACSGFLVTDEAPKSNPEYELDAPFELYDRGPKYKEDMIYVRLAHYTVKEYLQLHRTTQRFSWKNVNPAESHRQMAAACLTYITFDDFNEMDKVYREEPAIYRKYPLLKYSSCFWSWHYRKGSSDSIGLSLDKLFGLSSNSTITTGYFDNWRWAKSNRHDYTVYVAGAYLLEAAREGVFSVVKCLIEGGVDINRRCSSVDSETPLSVAAGNGYFNIVQLLVDNGIRFGEESDNEFVLRDAVRSGSLELVRYLIDQGVPPDTDNMWEETPLWQASMRGCYEIARLLIERGADANHMCSPIEAAARHGCLNTVELLFGQGAEINVAFKSALVGATYGRNYDIVLFLLDNGADLDGTGEKGEVALQVAVRYGCYDIVRLLVERGASNVEGALASAVRAGHSDIFHFLLGYVDSTSAEHLNAALAVTSFMRDEEAALEIAKILVDRGANPSNLSGGWGTLFQMAVFEGRYGLVRFLVDQGLGAEADAKVVVESVVFDNVINLVLDANMPWSVLGENYRKKYRAIFELLFNARASSRRRKLERRHSIHDFRSYSLHGQGDPLFQPESNTGQVDHGNIWKIFDLARFIEDNLEFIT